MTVQACTLDHTVFEQAQSNNSNKERPQCLAADFSRALIRERQVPNLKFQERHVQTFQNNKKKHQRCRNLQALLLVGYL